MKFKYLLLFVAISSVFSACKKDDKKDDSAVISNPPVGTIPSDYGNVTITFGGETMNIKGVCAIETTGSNSIIITDSQFADRKIQIWLKDNMLPIKAGTYKFFESGTEPPEDGIVLSFESFTTSPVAVWNSEASSGTATFTVTGNEVTCNLTGIVLQPHPNINQGAAASPGTLSGSFKCDIQ